MLCVRLNRGARSSSSVLRKEPIQRQTVSDDNTMQEAPQKHTQKDYKI